MFSAEFKQEAVRRIAERRAQEGRLQQISRELDVSADLLRAWAHQLKTGDALPLSDVFPGEGRLPGDQERGAAAAAREPPVSAGEQL